MISTSIFKSGTLKSNARTIRSQKTNNYQTSTLKPIDPNVILQFKAMRLLCRLARSISYRNSKAATIILEKDFPGVYSLLHPAFQQEFGKRAIHGSTVLLWKCPNGPDHEWKMSVSEVVAGYLHNQSHRTYINLFFLSRLLPFLLGKTRFCNQQPFDSLP